MAQNDSHKIIAVEEHFLHNALTAHFTPATLHQPKTSPRQALRLRRHQDRRNGQGGNRHASPVSPVLRAASDLRKTSRLRLASPLTMRLRR